MRVTSRGFRAWRVRPMTQRQRGDMVILAHIREQHRLSLESYARPRMTEELQLLGVNVGQRRVGGLMRDNGIKDHHDPEIQGDNGQQPHVQHRTKFVGSRFLSDWPQSKVGRRHQLYLDQ